MIIIMIMITIMIMIMIMTVTVTVIVIIIIIMIGSSNISHSPVSPYIPGFMLLLVFFPSARFETLY